jgi:hypothetical protein
MGNSKYGAGVSLELFNLYATFFYVVYCIEQALLFLMEYILGYF